MKAICDWHRKYEHMTAYDYKMCGKGRQEKAMADKRRRANVKPFQAIGSRNSRPSHHSR